MNKKMIASTLFLIALCVLAVVYYTRHTVAVPAAVAIDERLGQYGDASIDRVSRMSLGSDVGYQEAAVVKIRATRCQITLSMIPRQTSVVSGGAIRYDMTVINSGKNRCQNVSVSNYYSDSAVFVYSTPKPTASNYYWKIGTLEVGESYAISFEIRHSGESIENVVHMEACTSADKSADSCTKTSVKIIPQPTVDSTFAPASVSTTTPTTIHQTTSREYGSWVWNSPKQMSAAYINKILDVSVANGINTLYVTIDDYLDIYALPEGLEKEAAKNAYSDALESFIRAAQARGIAVDALGGWRDWAEVSSKWKASVIVNYVKEYNTSRVYKLRGFQYDVEPYLLPTYTTDINKARLLHNFVQLVDETNIRFQDTNIRFSVVVPHFYDDQQAWTPSFEYAGIDTYAFNHVLRILNTRAGSSIIIMAYRNTAAGDDGSIQLSKIEVAGASLNTSSTRIIVAQETGNVDPAYVTFYNTSKQRYLEEITAINNALGVYSNFGGIAVHYIDPFIELK